MVDRTLLVVDAANVVGSRPDGWWRDRAGATARLRDELAGVGRAGLPDLPPPVEVVLVVEGRAREVAAVDGVRVVAAPGSGDDAIVALLGRDAQRDGPAPTVAQRDRTAPTVAQRDGPPPPTSVVVVVTADRRLRDRVLALGARVRGPGWLRRSLPPPTGRG